MTAYTLTTAEAARILNLDPSRVRLLARQGRLHAHKAGRDWSYDEQQVRDFATIPRHPGRPPTTQP